MFGSATTRSQVCGVAVGSEGFLRATVPGDLSAACRASPACLASGLAQIRIDRTRLVDGIHPTKTGAHLVHPDARTVHAPEVPGLQCHAGCASAAPFRLPDRHVCATSAVCRCSIRPP